MAHAIPQASGHRHATRRIDAAADPARLEKDLEALKETALQSGAGRAAVIARADLVFVDSGISGPDVGYPSFHWPGRHPLDDLRQALDAYQYAVFFVMKPPAGMKDPGQGPVEDTQAREAMERLYKLVADVESEAFYQGHYLAMGLASGNCRAVFCSGEKRCRALVRGQVCRHPYKARPSLRAAGLDPEEMAANLGWKEAGTLAGLVMVA